MLAMSRSIIGIILGLIVCFFGGSIIYVNVPVDGLFSLDALVGYAVFGFGFIPIYYGYRLLSFKARIKKTCELIEKFQSPKGVAISTFAKELGICEEDCLKAIFDLKYFGYVNRIVIDYPKNKIIYIDSANVDGKEDLNFTNIKCNSCGATNTVLKGSEYDCEYCGAHNIADGSSKKVVIVEGGEYTDAEKLSSKENFKLGCLFPLVIFIPLPVFIIIIKVLFEPSISLFGTIGIALLTGLPLGIMLFLFFKGVYRDLRKKYTRQILAKYLSTIIATRKPGGVTIAELASNLREDSLKVEKNIQFLLKNEHLVGVSINGEPARIHYLDDDTDFDRFVPVNCQNCGGEFVATYGKANRCPYCDNGVELKNK